MKNLLAMIIQPKSVLRLAICSAVIGSLWALPLLSSARSQSNTITINNSSSREIAHVYFSPPDSNNWSADQLNDTAIALGGSTTLNLSCEQSQVKVIAEDKDGCFLYNTISCSGSAVWDITNAATPDCGN